MNSECNLQYIQPSSLKVLVLHIVPGNPKDNRYKTTEIAFEELKVPAYYLAVQSVLSLYSSGKITGLALDSGHGVTHAVPVFDGYSLPHSIERNYLAGNDLTKFMAKLLK